MSKTDEQTKLEKLVDNVFDSRSIYHRNLKHLANQFREYPQGTAVLKAILVELENSLSKQPKKLKCPIKLKTIDYIAGEKFEIVGKSRAGPDLRFQNTIAINYYPEHTIARTGRPKKGARPRKAGTITIGNPLWEKLPEIFSALEDPDYLNLVKSPEKTRKKKRKVSAKAEKGQIPKDIEAILKKQGIDTKALKDIPQLLEYGPDILQGKTAQFILSLNPSNRRNDLNWIRDEIRQGHLQDPTVIEAYYLFRSNTYRFESSHAASIIKFILENRKKPAKGLVGGILEDIQFKEQRGDFDKSKRRLNQIKKIIGKDYEKEVVTGAEALKIYRAVPGIAQERTEFNRKTILEYFSNQTEFSKVLEPVKTSFEAQKQEIARSKKAKEPTAWLMTKDEYRALREIYILAAKGEQTSYQNLRKRVSMPNSQRLFETLFVYSRKQQLSQESQDQGVLKRNYITIDNSLELMLDKLQNSYFGKPRNNTESEKQRLYKTHISCRKVQATKQRIPEIRKATDLGIILQQDADEINRAYTAVQDFQEVDKELREKIEFIYSLTGFEDEPDDSYTQLDTSRISLENGKVAKRNEPRFNIDDFVNVTYVSPEQKTAIETVYDKVMESRLERLKDKKEFATMQEYLNVIKDTQNQNTYYDAVPFLEDSTKVTKVERLLIPRRRKHKGLRYYDPTDVFETFKKLGQYIAAAGLGKEFEQKVKELAEDRYSLFSLIEGYSGLKEAIEQDKEKVLVSPDLVAKVNQDYKKVKQAESENLSILDQDSKSLYNMEGVRYDIIGYSTANQTIKDCANAFSRKRGGTGFLFWNQKRGWHQDSMSKEALTELIKRLYHRNQEAKTQCRIKIISVRY